MAQIESFLEVGQRGATTLALVLGGLWAYYKYIRGRVFSHRLELTIEGRLLEREAVATLSLEVRVKNVGLARFVIDQERTLLRAVVVHDGHKSDRDDNGRVELLGHL